MRNRDGKHMKNEHEKEGRKKKKKGEERDTGREVERKTEVSITNSSFFCLLCASMNKFLEGNHVNQFYYSIKHSKPTQSIF